MAVDAQAFHLGPLDSSNDGVGNLNGLNGFGFNPQFQQPLMAQNTSFVFSAMKGQASSFPQLGRDIDGYINLQNERLKLVLQEQRKQQLGAILRKLEARTAIVMRQKDEELAQATRKTIELQEFMKRLEMENQAWKRIAGENESMIANLNAAIEQLRERATIDIPSNVVDLDDAESCCDENENDEERDLKRRKKETTMVCRSCNSNQSSVLFLPCRHLCCCTACEAFLYACPVCSSVKKGTIEALIS